MPTTWSQSTSLVCSSSFSNGLFRKQDEPEAEPPGHKQAGGDVTCLPNEPRAFAANCLYPIDDIIPGGLATPPVNRFKLFAGRNFIDIVSRKAVLLDLENLSRHRLDPYLEAKLIVSALDLLPRLHLSARIFRCPHV